MIDALSLNCKIIALDTIFNREMLFNKESTFFNKNENSIMKKIDEFEETYNAFCEKNYNYILPKKYDWNFIVKQYLEVFYGLTNFQSM